MMQKDFSCFYNCVSYRNKSIVLVMRCGQNTFTKSLVIWCFDGKDPNLPLRNSWLLRIDSLTNNHSGLHESKKKVASLPSGRLWRSPDTWDQVGTRYSIPLTFSWQRPRVFDDILPISWFTWISDYGIHPKLDISTCFRCSWFSYAFQFLFMSI